jgi:hypothetical protein
MWDKVAYFCDTHNSIMQLPEWHSSDMNHVWKLSKYSEDHARYTVSKVSLIVRPYGTKYDRTRIPNEVCEINMSVCMLLLWLWECLEGENILIPIPKLYHIVLNMLGSGICRVLHSQLTIERYCTFPASFIIFTLSMLCFLASSVTVLLASVHIFVSHIFQVEFVFLVRKWFSNPFQKSWY